MAKRELEEGRGRQDFAAMNPAETAAPGRATEGQWEGRSEGHAPESEQQVRRSRRGFAAMDPAQHREISRRGGQASHMSGRGHEWNEDEAREAGRRGGEARWAGRRTQRDQSDLGRIAPTFPRRDDTRS